MECEECDSFIFKAGFAHDRKELRLQLQLQYSFRMHLRFMEFWGEYCGILLSAGKVRNSVILDLCQFTRIHNE